MNARGPALPELRDAPPRGRLLRSVFLLGSLAGLLFARPAHAALPQFARESEWVSLRTEHFVAITDAGPRVGSDVARKLERFSQALARLNPGLRSVSPMPTVVFVFRNQSELESYRPEASENLLAFFTMTEDRNLLVINGSPEGVARSEVVFHEFVHCYLSANYAAVPMWLNEGLAEYYSTCRLTRGSAEFGKPSMPVVEWMKGRPTIGLDLMFAMRADAPAYQRDNELRNQFYAQSFVLTHYLQSPSGGRAEGFDRFLDRLHAGAVPRRAFREEFPEAEWPAMIASLPAYLGRIEFEKIRAVTLPEAAAEDPHTVTLAPAEALTLLGELQLHLGAGRDAVAGEHFAAAVTLDPAFPAAHAGLGVVADRGGRPAEAEAHYARALSDAPRDPRVLNQCARGTIRRLFRQIDADAPPESIVTTARLARERYRRSLEADPGNLEALGGYGQSFAVAGDPPDSAATHGLERAVAALPARSDLAAALSILEARRGRSAEAEKLASTRVEPSAEGSDLTSLRDALRGTSLQHAVELAEQGRFADAESLFTTVIETTTDPQLRAVAREGLAMMRQSIADKAAVDLFNAGVELARASHLEEAREQFAKARDRAGSDEVKQRAEEAFVRVDAELRLRAATDLVKNDRLQEAEAKLTAADAAWPDDAYAARAARALADVRGRIEIKRGLASVKAGKLAEARASFQRVVDMDVSDPMKDYARARIKELDAVHGGAH